MIKKVYLLRLFFVLIISLTVSLSVNSLEVKNSDITIINLKDDFVSFWEQAKSQPFKKQEMLWRLIIESKYQDYFDYMVWGKGAVKEWKSKREKSLKKLFKNYRDIPLHMYINSYNQFTKTVDDSLVMINDKLVGLGKPMIVVIGPAITWGGSASKVGDIEYLTLGVDALAMKKIPHKMIKTLFVHEFFHVYHSTKADRETDESWYEKGELYWHLWGEGMATYGASYLLAEERLEKIMMFDEYKTFQSCNDPFLAKEFIKEFHNPAIDSQEPINYKKWFGATLKSSAVIKNGLPRSVGYYLGYKVIIWLKAHGLSHEFIVSLSATQAEQYILIALNAISKMQRCK
jgi:hypothetical protein